MSEPLQYLKFWCIYAAKGWRCFHLAKRQYIPTGLKVNDQLVAYVTRFLAVCHTSVPQMPMGSATRLFTSLMLTCLHLLIGLIYS